MTDEFPSLGWTVRPRRCRPYPRRSPSGVFRGGVLRRYTPSLRVAAQRVSRACGFTAPDGSAVWLSTPMVLRSGCLHLVATVPSFFCCHDLGLDFPRVSGLVVAR